jgi:2-polyprenyl-3-methyl-5-hydroxy-6-metoxy-1,4-benzoquinol methylase
VNYWDEAWEKRIGPYHPFMNFDKMAKMIYELTIRRHLYDMEKLDIGCGTGIHAMHLANINPRWKTRWTGIDLSDVATGFARKYGFNAICGDLFEHEFDKKFQLFLMLDSLEHIMDHDRLAKRIVELGKKPFMLFANIPLYTPDSEHDKNYERPVSVGDVDKFTQAIGAEKFHPQVYGINGYPYMMFEAEVK